MRVLYEYCEKGESSVNEDIYGVCGSYAWVIDGATDVFKAQSLFPQNEVSQYVTLLNKKLIQLSGDMAPAHEALLLDKAITDLYAELNSSHSLDLVPEFILPTFAIAIISQCGNTVSYFILGDCFFSTLSPLGTLLYTDKRIAKFSKENRRMIKEHYKTHRSPIAVERFQAVRAMANSSDGYPIGSVRGTGIKSAITGTIELVKNKRILLCSDGFLDYFKQNCLRNRNFFYEETIESEIIKAELFAKNEALFENNPRPKKLDDRTLLLLEMET